MILGDSHAVAQYITSLKVVLQSALAPGDATHGRAAALARGDPGGPEGLRDGKRSEAVARRAATRRGDRPRRRPQGRRLGTEMSPNVYLHAILRPARCKFGLISL